MLGDTDLNLTGDPGSSDLDLGSGETQSPPVYLGSVQVAGIYYGATPITALYLGAVKLWP